MCNVLFYVIWESDIISHRLNQKPLITCKYVKCASQQDRYIATSSFYFHFLCTRIFDGFFLLLFFKLISHLRVLETWQPNQKHTTEVSAYQISENKMLERFGVYGFFSHFCFIHSVHLHTAYPYDHGLKCIVSTQRCTASSMMHKNGFILECVCAIN